MAQNFVEKIVQKYALDLPKNYKVKSGDFVNVSPAYVMTHDNTGAVIPKFIEAGAEKLYNPQQVVFTLDHDIQNKSEANITKYKKIEKFAQDKGNDFYPAGRGIGHQIMIEEGYAFPGSMMVASDSHSNTYGGLGVLGTPVVRTDAAAIWATGKTWWQIPPVVKVTLSGKPGKGVSGKDIILALCGTFNKEEVLNTIVEFSGDGVENISVEQRLTIANMTTEWGALGGLFPVDQITLNWLKEKIVEKPENHPRLNTTTLKELLLERENLSPDADAFYTKEIEIDLGSISPVVSGPHDPKKIFRSAKKKKIDKAYLLSCTNGRLEDFKEAAAILENKRIDSNVKFYISAASSLIQEEAEEKGYWQTLISAGATELPSGCGPCIGLGEGLLEENETGISATNRNFKGRMGSKDAEAYLASPATVAYSALEGFISNPYFNDLNITASIKSNTPAGKEVSPTEIITGFPERLTGEIIFCDQDNMNTDLIYAGKYTYNDDFTSADQAKVVMENYDPEFSSKIKEDTILVSGYNFGSGSSREQAATSLKYAGIKLVVAGSFSQTYIRNAINNGFLCVEIPELLEDLRKRFAEKTLTLQTEIKVVIDFSKSLFTADDKSYNFTPVGKAAQEIIVCGGLENLIKQQINQRQV